MINPRIIVAGCALIIIAAAIGYESRAPVRTRDAIAASKDWQSGYLGAADAMEGRSVIPPPPAPGSAAMAQDEAARAEALKLRGTPRYEIARADADRSTVQTGNALSCALGTEISEESVPRLYRLMMRMRIDIRRSVFRAKDYYDRRAPFQVYKTPTCSTSDEELASAEGSYPSARSAVGWAYGQLLAELNPARADIILQRGRDFGESRVICDAAWQSDVDAGRDVGTAVLAKLGTNKEFQADLAAAREEVSTALRAGRKPSGNCASEMSALAKR